MKGDTHFVPNFDWAQISAADTPTGISAIEKSFSAAEICKDGT